LPEAVIAGRYDLIVTYLRSVWLGLKSKLGVGLRFLDAEISSGKLKELQECKKKMLTGFNLNRARGLNE
jgi:hypothetical protein